MWQYYPGEGIQLQVLGTFGKANGLWMAPPATASCARCSTRWSPLAAQRGPALAWEYYFDFGGGVPPWTSGMAQATGIQALARAGAAAREPVYLEAARQALRLFPLRRRVGVRVRDAARRALPALLVRAGPDRHQRVGADARRRCTTTRRSRQRRRRAPVPRRRPPGAARRAAGDTGAWSLYQLGGAESDLGYHKLLRGFLHNLCDRIDVEVYCATATAYTRTCASRRA